MDKIIYCQGGLGDHLALSTLPEEFTKLGHDVYIHNNYLVRNDEIFNLVWRMNPFIKGFSEQLPNSGHIFANPPDGTIPWMRHVEILNGIDSNNLSPRIYRNHNIIDYLSDKTILNLECISADYNPQSIIKSINEIILKESISKNDILHLSISANVNQYKNSFFVPKEIFSVDLGYEKFHINNIYDHCDVIKSCKRYITLHSGGASLAAAIRNDNVYVVMSDKLKTTFDIKCFIYENQNYVF